MRPRDAMTLLTVLSVIVMLALSATVEAADKRKQSAANRPAAKSQPVQRKSAPAAKSQPQGVRKVVRADDNRRVVKERRITKPAGGPKTNTFEKTVVRNDPNEARKVELNRRIIQKEGQPTRNIFDKTVTRATDLGDNKRRVVTLNKTITNVGGERKKVDFDRQVVIKHAPGRDDKHRHGHGQWDRPGTFHHYPHGHSRHHCTSGCSHYRVSYRSYPHGHAHHHCHTGCSHYKSGWSINIGFGTHYSSGSITYSSGYDPCGRCGGGYYQRVWVPGCYTTHYDYCGRPYSVYTAGSYRTTWIEHSCH